MSEEERSSWSDEERERYLSEFNYIYDSDGVEIVPGETKTVSTHLRSWYPHYALTTGRNTQARKHECKIMLVELL